MKDNASDILDTIFVQLKLQSKEKQLDNKSVDQYLKSLSILANQKSVGSQPGNFLILFANLICFAFSVCLEIESTLFDSAF